MNLMQLPGRARSPVAAAAALFAVLMPVIGGADSSSPVTSVYSFSGGSDGAAPYGQLVQGSDGYLYGTTSVSASGACCGGIYKVATNGSGFKLLYAFTGGDDGATPMSGLLRGSDGNFYGVTTGNGASGNASNGTVFKLTPAGALSTLYTFDYNDGYSPNGPLVQASDGTLYGTTLYGGEDGSGDGTVFKISPDGSGFATLYAFDAFAGNVEAGVILGSDGKLYGTTHDGGTAGYGSVYSLNTDGSGYTTLHSFASSGSDGREPTTALVQGSDGTLYGTTPYGGSAPCGPSGCGTVYKLSPDGSNFATIYSFTGGVDGSDPVNSLTVGANGNLYSGNFNGVVYELQTDGTFVGAYSLDQYDVYQNGDFVSPASALTLASDGRMYGVTYNGGADDQGSVYSIDPSGLSVYPAATVSIAATPQIVQAGNRAVLTWSSTNAVSCTASGEWSGSQPLSGSTVVKPLVPGPHSYTLTCVNAGNQPTAASTSLLVRR